MRSVDSASELEARVASVLGGEPSARRAPAALSSYFMPSVLLVRGDSQSSIPPPPPSQQQQAPARAQPAPSQSREHEEEDEHQLMLSRARARMAVEALQDDDEEDEHDVADELDGREADGVSAGLVARHARRADGRR